MLLAHKPSKILVTGKSGSGKSTYFTRYVINAPYPRRFLFDHEGEFQARLGIRAATNEAGLLDSLRRPWTIYDPAEQFPGDTEAGFAFFCEWVFEMSRRLPGAKLFCCDELQKLVGTNTVSWELALLLETGRRYGVDAIMISQQPNLIHNRVRGQLTECVTFQQIEPNALKFLEEIGYDGEAVKALRPGEFWARNLTSLGEARGRVF